MTHQEGVVGRIKKTVDFAYNNIHSSWYRDHCEQYGIAQCPVIASIDDISRLPLIARKDLNSVPLFSRAFTDPKTANDIRSTSGTSGQDPLFYLRDIFYNEMTRRMYADGVRRKLFFWNYHVSAVLAHADLLAGVQTVICDPHQLEKNTKLVKLLSIDTLAGSPSVLLMFGDMLKSSDANTQIKYLQLNGEPATTQALSALRRLYPKAGHYSDYSLGEVGQDMGIRTPYCNKQNPSYYHINTKDVYVETVSNELVVTRYIVPTVTPLIRYRTGDNVSWMGHDTCSCGHNGLSIEMSGRQNVDFVRIAGVEIRNDEIVNIIEKFNADLETFVYTEVRDKVIDNAQIVTLKIMVVPIKKDTGNSASLSQRIQKTVMGALRVSSTTTLQEMVTAGLFATPEIEFLPTIPVSNKRQGIKLITDEI